MLRQLCLKDANGMLEWMKDNSINQYFRFNASEISEESVRKFIEKSQGDKDNKHYAVVDQEDIYLGTISLKNIDLINHNAEYSIALRKCAIGMGIAKSATEEILRIAFDELKLHRVYLNVLSDNTRAIKFYSKVGFQYEGEFKEHLSINGAYKNIKWYAITKMD